MTAADSLMAARIGALVRAQPGVIAVYRAGQPVGRAIAAVKDALVPGHADDPEPTVSVHGDRVSVAAAIGVESDSAVETCRAVYDRIAEWLIGHGRGDYEIIVTVAYVKS